MQAALADPDEGNLKTIADLHRRRRGSNNPRFAPERLDFLHGRLNSRLLSRVANIEHRVHIARNRTRLLRSLTSPRAPTHHQRHNKANNRNQRKKNMRFPTRTSTDPQMSRAVAGALGAESRTGMSFSFAIYGAAKAVVRALLRRQLRACAIFRRLGSNAGPSGCEVMSKAEAHARPALRAQGASNSPTHRRTPRCSRRGLSHPSGSSFCGRSRRSRPRPAAAQRLRPQWTQC